jgi:hypothetical protein
LSGSLRLPSLGLTPASSARSMPEGMCLDWHRIARSHSHSSPCR